MLKLRAASYTEGGTDLASLFARLDKDDSGTLDYNEFKRVVRRWVRALNIWLRALIINYLNRVSVRCMLHCDIFTATKPTAFTNSGLIFFLQSKNSERGVSRRKTCKNIQDGRLMAPSTFKLVDYPICATRLTYFLIYFIYSSPSWSISTIRYVPRDWLISWFILSIHPNRDQYPPSY